MGDVPSVTLDGTLADPEEIHVEWRRGIAPYFDAVPLFDVKAPPKPLKARQFFLGAWSVIESDFSSQMYVRDENWVRQHDDSSHLLLQVFSKGENHVIHGGEEFTETQGGVYAVDCRTDVHAVSTDASAINLILPRSWMEEAVPELRTARGSLFEPGTASAAIATTYIQSLPHVLPDASQSDIPFVINSAAGLLSALAGKGDAMASGAQSGTLQAMYHFLDKNLGDPSLGVQTLCRHFNCSRATLYRLFQSSGGVRAAILRRRLVAALEKLTKPGDGKQNIAAIAFDLGFNSSSHFSTVFRQQFGVTPREAREAALAGLGDAKRKGTGSCAESDGETMYRWSKALGKSLTMV